MSDYTIRYHMQYLIIKHKFYNINIQCNTVSIMPYHIISYDIILYLDTMPILLVYMIKVMVLYNIVLYHIFSMTNIIFYHIFTDYSIVKQLIDKYLII